MESEQDMNKIKIYKKIKKFQNLWYTVVRFLTKK